MERLTWTDEMRTRLERLLAAGMSYRQAAAEMGIRPGQAKGAAIYHGMTPGQPRTPWREWERAEYDRIEQLLEQGMGYTQIAKVMGITPTQAKGAAQRLGLMKPERMGAHRRRDDWTTIDRITEDCIEARLMTIPQAHQHLAALGYTLALSSLYRRVRQNAELKRRAVLNSKRRKQLVGARIQAGRAAAKKRQERAA